MTVRIVRIQVLQSQIDKLIDVVTDRELKRRADNVVREIQSLAPVSDGQNSYTDGVPGRASGGRLRDSFRIGKTIQRGKPVLRIFSNAQNARGQFYAGLVTRGTKPHGIRAINVPDLAFRWIRRGVFVITPEVQHPGTQPNNFIREGLRRGFHR